MRTAAATVKFNDARDIARKAVWIVVVRLQLCAEGNHVNEVVVCSRIQAADLSSCTFVIGSVEMAKLTEFFPEVS